jgi:hypothetical protein
MSISYPFIGRTSLDPVDTGGQEFRSGSSVAIVAFDVFGYLSELQQFRRNPPQVEPQSKKNDTQMNLVFPSS